MNHLKKIAAVVALCGSLVASGLVAGPTQAAAAQQNPVVATGALVTTSPRAEYIEDPLRSNPQPWLDACPAGRFCAYQLGAGGNFIGFQFYRCTEYKLTNWGVNDGGVRLVRNNQNVTVHYLDSRHAVLDTTPPFQSDAVNWRPVWYLSICN